MHYGRYRHRRRDMFAVHSAASSHERVQSARVERTKRRAQVTFFSVRIYRRNGQRLYLCRMPVARRCSDGQVSNVLCLA